MNRRKLFPLALLFFALCCAGAVPARSVEKAQEIHRADSAQKPPEAQPCAREGEKFEATRHTLKPAGGGLLNYTATTGYLRLVNESGKPEADIFFTAYTVEGQTEARPLTFAFNGGPGASSMWLHMGVAGPVRAMTGQKAAAGPSVASNPLSWLAYTDLVFIDPIGTGFSRAIPAENAKQYFNTQNDISSTGEFIQLYVDRFGRWRCPKYLAGESYGAMRAAGLLRYLYENAGIEIDGLILISPALDLNVIHQDISNDLPFMLFVPSYAATAWYHKKTGPELRSGLSEVLAEAEKWAVDQYLPALARGDGLSSPDTDRVAARLSSLTGISEQLIRNRNLRITRHVFENELLRSEGLSLGFMDGRTAQRTTGGGFLDDPSMVMTIESYTGALNEYMRDVLHFSPGIPYIFFSREANSGWNWGSVFSGNDAVESIRRAFNRNGRMKVLVAAGYFDLDVPYFAATYTMSHLGIDPKLAANITIRFFPGGHMFYTGGETLEEFNREVARFFTDITGR
jgi:carboxypeptidase C (cathepsin A)